MAAHNSIISQGLGVYQESTDEKSLKVLIEDSLIIAEKRGREKALEECAKLAETKYYPHTFASENSDEYIEQWEIGKSIAKLIRALKQGELNEPK